MHDPSMAKEKEWFESFVESIPCPKCQHHFESFIEQNPVDYTSRQGFFEWTVRAHNWVNRALNKPEVTFSQAVSDHHLILLL